MKHKLLILIIIALITSDLLGQAPKELQLFPARLIGGDTLACIDIPEVFILLPRKFKNKREETRYWKLVRDLKITYPYAVLIKHKMEELNSKFQTLHTDKERKEYIKQAERELRSEYEGDLTDLTISQGRLLIKLVDRETGKTTYTLVKELRGTFQAIFWQTVAKIFGSSLKAEYDAKGDDKLTEELLLKIQKGYY
jgi:chaperonin GroEL (HSP60 family)